MNAELLQVVQSSLAELRHEMLAQVRRMQSPWLDRQAAADYAHVSPGKIDELYRMGKIKRYRGIGDARYKKIELDTAIEGLPFSAEEVNGLLNVLGAK